jgi:hypothetical protein
VSPILAGFFLRTDAPSAKCCSRSCIPAPA